MACHVMATRHDIGVATKSSDRDSQEICELRVDAIAMRGEFLDS